MEGDEFFPTTSWDLIKKTQCSDKGFSALSEVCQIYWYPIYAFLRSKDLAPEDAADLTQGFLHKLIKENKLAQAQQSKGRFRLFLLQFLDEYLAASKNSITPSSEPTVDSEWAEHRFLAERHAPEMSPDRAFDHRCALVFLDHCENLLRQKYENDGKRDEFGLLQPFLSWKKRDNSYNEIAAQLDTSVGNVRQMVLRLRRDLLDCIYKEATKTIGKQLGKSFVDELRQILTEGNGET